MRRLVAAGVSCVCVFALSGVGANAGPTKPVSYTLSGTSVWSADFLPPSFAIQGDVFDGKAKIGTYSGTLAAGAWESYTLGRCTEGPECASVTGGTITFKLKGSQLSAVVEPGGLVTELLSTPSHETYIFEPLRVSITGGTHAYARAQGTLALHYETSRFQQEITPTGYCSPLSTCPISDTGTLAGTIAR
jgi:hypothetical protein